MTFLHYPLGYSVTIRNWATAAWFSTHLRRAAEPITLAAKWNELAHTTWLVPAPLGQSQSQQAINSGSWNLLDCLQHVMWLVLRRGLSTCSAFTCSHTPLTRSRCWDYFFIWAPLLWTLWPICESFTVLFLLGTVHTNCHHGFNKIKRGILSADCSTCKIIQRKPVCSARLKRSQFCTKTLPSPLLMQSLSWLAFRQRSDGSRQENAAGTGGWIIQRFLLYR